MGLEEMARRNDIKAQSASALLFLAAAVEALGGNAVDLLSQARDAYPGELWRTWRWPIAWHCGPSAIRSGQRPPTAVRSSSARGCAVAHYNLVLC